MKYKIKYNPHQDLMVVKGEYTLSETDSEREAIERANNDAKLWGATWVTEGNRGKIIHRCPDLRD